MSKLWVSYLKSTGDMHRCFKSLHDRYGDVVRVGVSVIPPFIVSGYSASLIGTNELTIRGASFIHPVLEQGGLPKGPRACAPSQPLLS